MSYSQIPVASSLNKGGVKFTLTGALELRGENFAVRYGIVQAPPVVYGLPSDMSELLFGSLRCDRIDYPVLFDPSLYQDGEVDTYAAYLWPIRSSVTPPPPPPLDFQTSLCLIVTQRVERSHNLETTIMARPVYKLNTPGHYWALAIQGFPLLIPAQCRYTPPPPQKYEPHQVRLATLTGMSQTGYHTRMWLLAQVKDGKKDDN